MSDNMQPPTTCAISSGRNRRRYGLLAVMVALIAFIPWHRGETLPTPLEVADYSRLSTSAEISTYLQSLARDYPQARVEVFGTTVQGRPLEALLLTSIPGAAVSTPQRLTIEIIGSQHGTEGAGAESLQVIARELLAGTLRHVLAEVDVVLVPNANPDGRELHKRVNANRVNLNVDFVALSQPESQALVESLERYRPEVLLDVHESAVLKKKSLALEGYMTDFSVQFEMGNNPNIAPSLSAFALDEILTPWVAAIDGNGLRAHRYIGEIKSSRQPVTNGGLTLNNLRNRAAIEDRLSFLIESRQDPRRGDYPTFENIRERVEKQRISIDRFLTIFHDKRVQALAAVAAARHQAESMPLALDARYVAAPGQPPVSIELRRIADGKLETIEFADHRQVDVADLLPMPAAYLIRAPQAELCALLDLQQINYQFVVEPRTDWAVEFAIDSAATADTTLGKVRERVVRVRARPGDVWLDLAQPRGRLAAILLEPNSTSGLLRTSKYASLITADKVLPIYRISR